MAEANALQTAEQAKIEAEQNIAVRQRELALKQSEILAETDMPPRRGPPGPVRWRKPSEIRRSCWSRRRWPSGRRLKERQLDTEVRKPADAQSYKVETEAEARPNASILEVEAMDKRAAAFARYNDAAVPQMLIEVLPQLAKPKQLCTPRHGLHPLRGVQTATGGASCGGRTGGWLGCEGDPV